MKPGSRASIYLLVLIAFIATACSHLATNIDSHPLAIGEKQPINRLLVVESDPNFGTCNRERAFTYDESDSFMAVFNQTLRDNLAKCGINVNFANSRLYTDPMIQSEITATAADAVLSIQNVSKSESQTVLAPFGIAGNSAIMKATFDTDIYNKNGQKIWYAQMSYDRTPDLIHSGTSCFDTGIRFSNALIDTLNKDKVITCSTILNSQ